MLVFNSQESIQMTPKKKEIILDLVESSPLAPLHSRSEISNEEKTPNAFRIPSSAPLDSPITKKRL